MRHVFHQFIAPVAAVSVIALAGPAVAKYDMKVGYATTNDPQHELGVRFVKLVKERSNGEIQGRVFPTSQLGKIPRQVEAIQLGTQEIFLTPPVFLQGINPAFQVGDSPGLFANHAHAQRSINHPPFRDKFLQLGIKKGIVGANIWVYDGNSYLMSSPIKTLSDFKGKKIRVLASQIERAIVGSVNATGVPIPFTEVVPAIQRRVVDGARTSLVVGVRAKFPTVTKHLTITNGSYITTGTWVSKVWLEKLPKNLQKVVLDASAESSDWASMKSSNFVDAAIEEWKEAGATVYRLSSEEHKTYMEGIAPLGDEVLGKHKNPQVREMFNLLKAAAKATM